MEYLLVMLVGFWVIVSFSELHITIGFSVKKKKELMKRKYLFKKWKNTITCKLHNLYHIDDKTMKVVFVKQNSNTCMINHFNVKNNGNDDDDNDDADDDDDNDDDDDDDDSNNH